MTDCNNISQFFMMWVLLMVFFFILILIELLQLIVHPRVYVQSLENWLQILLIIVIAIICSGVVQNEVVKYYSFPVAVLLGLPELLLILGRLPQLSVQQEMLRTVGWTCLKFMAFYAILLISFDLFFYLIFSRISEKESSQLFGNPLSLLLTTIFKVMDEFRDNVLSVETGQYIIIVIFFLFSGLVSTVLLNVLNGLAVNDITVIKRDAEMVSFAARAKLISRIEGVVNVLPVSMKSRVELKEEMFVIYPNRRNRIGYAAARSLINIVIKKKENNEKDKSV